MAVSPAMHYVVPVDSLVPLAGAHEAKRPHPDKEHNHAFGPYLRKSTKHNARHSASERFVRYRTPPSHVPSLCDSSGLSPVSTACTTKLHSSLAPLSPHREILHLADENHCQSRDGFDSITRWLDDTSIYSGSDQPVQSIEAEHPVSITLGASKDEESSVSNNSYMNESRSVHHPPSSSNVGWIELASSQAVVDFHRTAVRQLLQEFRQWKAWRTRNSGSDSNSAAPVSDSPAIGKASTQVPAKASHAPHQSSSTNTRKRQSDEDGEDDEPSPKRRKNKSTKETGSRRALACPFVVRDQLRYRKCFRYEALWDISRLKQHLQREHKIPIHCSRCSQTFKTTQERVDHERQDPPCQILPPQQWDGIDETQQRQLNKRVSSKNSETENWNLIYSILFPESPLPESPYFHHLMSQDETSAMRKWFRDNAQEYFQRQHLPSELRGQEAQMRAFLDSVLTAMVDAYADSTERASASAEHTPRTQRYRTALLDTPSDQTNSTPATTFSSRSADTSRECLSPCPQQFPGPLPSSQPFQALLEIDENGRPDVKNNDEFGDFLAPAADVGSVPYLTISEAFDSDNSLGISFLDGIDLNLNMLVDGTVSETVVSRGEDTSF